MDDTPQNKTAIQFALVLALSAAVVAQWLWGGEPDPQPTTNIAHTQGHTQTLYSRTSATVESVHTTRFDDVSTGDTVITLSKDKWEQKQSELREDILYLRDRLSEHEAQQELLSKALSVSGDTSYQDGMDINLLYIGLAKRNIKETEKELEAMQAYAESFTIVAERNAQVQEIHVAPGTPVYQDTPLITLVPEQEYTITAYFKEADISSLDVGTRVDIRLDAYPETTYPGHISAFSALSGSAFGKGISHYSASNGESRVPVTIVFDRYPEVRMSIGLSATVSVRLP